jgi:hypothetical protein
MWLKLGVRPLKPTWSNLGYLLWSSHCLLEKKKTSMMFFTLLISSVMFTLWSLLLMQIWLHVWYSNKCLLITRSKDPHVVGQKDHQCNLYEYCLYMFPIELNKFYLAKTFNKVYIWHYRLGHVNLRGFHHFNIKKNYPQAHLIFWITCDCC